jgi:type IV pilus assembly protein PilP
MNARHNIRSRRILLPLIATLVGGCVSKDMSDLENYAAEVLQRKGGEIEPLPPIKPYESYLYQAEKLGLRDPFRSFLEEDVQAETATETADPKQEKYVAEISTHNREELEGYELDALRMVGVLENTEALWAIVRDQEGVVHRLQVGNYLGRNFGKITNIQEDRIDIREIVKDSLGRWEERAASLALSEE